MPQGDAVVRFARSGAVALALVGGALAVWSAPLQSQRASVPATVEPQPALSVVTDGAVGAMRVVLRDGAREAGSIAVPAGVTRAAVAAAIADALWHPDGRDVAFGVRGEEQSFVVVFLEQPAGAHTAVDVSRVERANIGAIGPDRVYPYRYTRPVEWLPRHQVEGTGPYSGRPAVQISFRTELHDDAGVRYAAAEALIVTRDGTPLWR